jgi:sugar fermentation stimulation protein A
VKLYHDLTQCSFLCRVNRFIAKCLVDGEVTVVHVKNTGRLKELLVPGAACWLEKSGNPARKTAYDLVAVEKDGRVVNIDSQCPNLIAREWVQQGGWGDIDQVQSEVKWGDSRFDLAYRTGETLGFIEVKGVTLFDESGVAIFPDAPTSRGAKHLRGLIQAKHAGMETGVIFVIMKEDATALRPNDATDPDFAAALREAASAGVRIVAACCRVTADSAQIVRTVPVML